MKNTIELNVIVEVRICLFQLAKKRDLSGKNKMLSLPLAAVI